MGIAFDDLGQVVVELAGIVLAIGLVLGGTIVLIVRWLWGRRKPAVRTVRPSPYADDVYYIDLPDGNLLFAHVARTAVLSSESSSLTIAKLTGEREVCAAWLNGLSEHGGRIAALTLGRPGNPHDTTVFPHPRLVSIGGCSVEGDNLVVRELRLVYQHSP